METIPVIVSPQLNTETSWTGMKAMPAFQLTRFLNQSAIVTERLLREYYYIFYVELQRVPLKNLEEGEMSLL